MLIHKLYTIADDDIFDIANYSEVAGELSAINEKFAEIPSPFKADITISYFKDHCIQKSWVYEYASFVNNLISLSPHTAHIEALFAASKMKQPFLNGFMNYIKTTFSQ